MVFDWDDFGTNQVISDLCQSRDCRIELESLKQINPNFKCTLFTIPAYMSLELSKWAEDNIDWVELAVHGFRHTDNYESSKWTFKEMDYYMKAAKKLIPTAKGFKAPGWQISDDCYLWLMENEWWVADQAYNDPRRPVEISAYVNHDGTFYTHNPNSIGGDSLAAVEAWHGHTWNCVGNGIEETFDHVSKLVKEAESFEFISEVL